MAVQTKLEILLLAKDEASGKIKGVTKSLGTLGGTVAKGAAIGLGAAAIGLGAVGAGALKLARDAAPIKGIQDSFIALGESAEFSSDKMLSSLQDSSAGMVTNTDLMTSFNKAAQLVSVDFAKTLPDSMGAFGKVAAATGEDVGFLMDSYVTGIGRLSPMILDNLGIQVDLVQAYEDFAAANGLVASELTKSQQQTALANQANEMLLANTAAMPEVFGSAEQKFASLGVTFKNIKDQVGVALLPVFTKLLDVVGPMLSGAFETVMPFIERFVDLTGQLIGVVLEMGLQSSETQEVLASMFGEETAATIMGIIEKFIWLKDTITDFVQGTLIPFVQEHWEAIKAALIAVGAILAGAVIVSGILSIVAAIAALFTPIGIIIAVVALLAVAWSKNWGGIQDKTKAVIDFIRNIIDVTLTWITEFWDQHGAMIMGIVQGIWDTISAIFQWFVDYVTLIFQAFSLAFAGDWEGFGEKLREIWDHVWETIKDIVGKAWDWIRDAVSDAIDAIVNFFSETDWLQLGLDIVQGIADGISAGAKWAVDAIKSLAKALWSTITGFFGASSYSKLMASLGDDLMVGLGLGIQASAGVPVAATLGAGAGIANAISGSYNIDRTDNFFIQDTAAAAFLLEQQAQNDYDEIDLVI